MASGSSHPGNSGGILLVCVSNPSYPVHPLLWAHVLVCSHRARSTCSSRGPQVGPPPRPIPHHRAQPRHGASRGSICPRLSQLTGAFSAQRVTVSRPEGRLRGVQCTRLGILGILPPCFVSGCIFLNDTRNAKQFPPVVGEGAASWDIGIKDTVRLVGIAALLAHVLPYSMSRVA